MTSTPPTPTLTVYNDSNPCPRVEILVTPMPGDVDKVSVYRSWAGRRTLVRSAGRASTAGDFLVVDYEVPLSTEVTYAVEAFDAAGTVSALSTGSVVTVPHSKVWLQDPLSPANSLAFEPDGVEGLTIQGGSFWPSTFRLPGELASIDGQEESLGLFGVRQAPTAIPLNLTAWDRASATKVTDLVRHVTPICIRPPVSLVPEFDGLFYAAAVEFTPSPLPGWQRFQFALSVASIKGPSASIVVNVRTLDDLMDEADTLDGLMAIYATFTDVLRGN